MSISDSILFPKGRKISDRRYHEAGVRGRYEKNLRVVRGRIDTTGPTINEGVGFTVVRDAAGQITLTFDPPFSAAPTITATVDRAVGTTARIAYLDVAATATSCQMSRVDISDTRVDGTLAFIATGPA